MQLLDIYQCFSDQTRLRILNLLSAGPLCVCHFQEALDEPQVKISKHLSYLKSRGLVQATREANWMIYSLPSSPSKEFNANLACLRDCTQGNPIFRADRARVERLRSKFENGAPLCGKPKSLTKSAKSK